MALLEAVVDAVQIDDVFVDFFRRNRLRCFKALTKASAEDLARDHQLIARQILLRIILGIDVDHFYDPVAVSATGRGEKTCDDVASQSEIPIKNL